MTFFRTNYLRKIFLWSYIPPFLLHAIPTSSTFLPYILNDHFNLSNATILIITQLAQCEMLVNIILQIPLDTDLRLDTVV